MKVPQRTQFPHLHRHHEIFCTADATTFATGSKDTLDIAISGLAVQPGQQRQQQDRHHERLRGGVHGAPNGDKIIYFGLEKNKDNGNNNVGFWFLQGNAELRRRPAGHVTWTGRTWSATSWSCPSSPTAAASAHHRLPVGRRCNAARSIAARGTRPATASATSASSGHDLCDHQLGATPVQRNNTSRPWLTADATLGVGHTIVPPDFFEGGINLTKAFAEQGGTAPRASTPSSATHARRRQRRRRCSTTPAAARAVQDDHDASTGTDA